MATAVSNDQPLLALETAFLKSNLFSRIPSSEIEQIIRLGGFQVAISNQLTSDALGFLTSEDSLQAFHKDLGLEFPTVMLHSLAVSQNFHRRIFARGMVAKHLYKQAARNLDFEKVYVLAANEASRVFFKRVEFKEIGQHPELGTFMSVDLASYR